MGRRWGEFTLYTTGTRDITAEAVIIRVKGRTPMFLGLWNYDEDDDPSKQDTYSAEQQGGREAPSQAEGSWLQQSEGGLGQTLQPLWEQPTQGSGGVPAARRDGAASEARARSQPTRQAQRENDEEYEDQEDRTERRRIEDRENFAKERLDDKIIETIGEALDYCRELIAKQMDRAEKAAPPMNESIYGDSQARKAVVTLLPDELIRALFLRTTRDPKAYPRLKPLFGTPPYHFLRPEDAGLVRAAGISSSRTNMTYERVGETAAYGQFGSAHLIDEFSREYRVLPTRSVQMADSLPFDMGSFSVSQPVFMNVRVPKRSKEQKVALMKDQTKRRAVVFPYVGETLRVRYSDGLRRVWGQREDDDRVSQILVKQMIPRSVNGATAAVVGVVVF